MAVLWQELFTVNGRTEGRKMRFFMFLSNFIFPLMIFVIVGYGLLMKKDIYSAFYQSSGGPGNCCE